MTLSEAITSKKNFKRKLWHDSFWICNSNSKTQILLFLNGGTATFTSEDILATDWIIE